MQSSSSTDIDLLFVALHHASLQCSQKNSIRSSMNRGLYFYDQYNNVSHVGGIHRYKRHAEELNEALHHVRIALTTGQENQSSKSDRPLTTINPTPSPIKQQNPKLTTESLLRTIQRRLNTPIEPDDLCRELDILFQRYDLHSKTTISSSSPPILSSNPRQSAQHTIVEDEEQENDPLAIQEAEDEDELIAATNQLPKVSLPASIIIQLHYTWNHLIEDAQYNYKTWRTKAGEESWNRYVERKRLDQMNNEKQRTITVNKQGYRRRLNSRSSTNSLTRISRQQHSLTANLPMRTNRSSSRVSFSSANPYSQLDHLQKLKPIHQGSLESLTESVKSGIHVEFKLSTQIDENKQQQQAQIQSLNQLKGIMFDVPKPSADLYDDIIALIQSKCRQLLTDMKRKIAATTNQNSKTSIIWFYGENKYIRDKTNLLTLNESAKRQKSKFIYSILRREIPEKYSIEIEIPQNKRKCYLQLANGSTQIYYPSGRLAVLRLNISDSCTIFFNDTDIVENQFLGLVTSNGSVFIMQPTLHARFVTDVLHERAYLCNGKTGIIEKQIQCHLNNGNGNGNGNESTPTAGVGNDDDDILPPLFDNTIQIQLNNLMQLEYNSPRDIRFAYASHREEFQFQLGINQTSSTPSTSQTPTSAFEQNNNSNKKKVSSKPKSSTIHLNQFTNLSEKQQIQVERLLDGHVNIKDLPMMKDLIFLRKKIRTLCSNWLKQCRITLGVMDIEAYCLPDWPSTSNELLSTFSKVHHSKSAKPLRVVQLSTKDDLNNQEFLQANEKEQILRTMSAKKTEPNLLKDTITQFVSRTNSGKTVQSKSSPRNLPSIKGEGSASTRIEETNSPRIIIPFDLPFACPKLIRQRSIRDSSITSMFSETCQCRFEHVPTIRDLEFDTFIQLTNQLNPRQLIVIGIINSNLRQLESQLTDESNQLYQIINRLHSNINYGRSQISSCRLATNDDYRCFIYDLAEATKQSSFYGPLLVRRHHVQPGFILIYQHGQLIFGDSIFNGYGKDFEDLEKQLNHLKQQQLIQRPLPDQFKFISNHRPRNPTLLKSV